MKILHTRPAQQRDGLWGNKECVGKLCHGDDTQYCTGCENSTLLIYYCNEQSGCIHSNKYASILLFGIS